MTFAENSNCYDLVVKIFIELRNKGVSLSAFDLDILGQWERNSISSEFISQVMVEIYEECQKKGKPFPASLSSIARRVDKILIKMRDT